MVKEQLADLDSAREFLGEVLQRLDPFEAGRICALAHRKSEMLRTVLQDGGKALGEAQLVWLFNSSFVSRRKTKEILGSSDPDELRDGFDCLLVEDMVLSERVKPLQNALSGFPLVSRELPYELLHFLWPEEYWLWANWMWDPHTETGALRLITSDEVDLFGEDDAETYELVSSTLGYAFETMQAANFKLINRDPFSMDVFLGGVYAVYMYTVLQMRMTKEFNKIVPNMSELIRRLLGVHKLEEC